MKRFALMAIVLPVVLCCASLTYGADNVLLESKQIRITDADFEASLVRIPEENRAEVLASKSRIRTMLENLIISKTLAARARSAGIDRDPGTLKQLQLAEENILTQAYLNQKILALKLPDFTARARELYKVNAEKYTTPAKVHASHILVDTNTRTAEAALQRAQEVRAKALAGKPFPELAEEYSDDPSAQRNKGDLGFFEAGNMVKPFSDMAFSLKTPGEISQPVKTNFGYHLIQFHEKQPKRTRPFDDVKQEIMQGLRDEFVAQYRKDMLSEILADPSMKLYDEAVDRFHTKLDDGDRQGQKK